MENIKNGVKYIMEEFPIIAGILFLIIALLLIIYQLKKNESYKDYETRTATSKSVEIKTWILVIILFIVGLITIF